MNTSYQSTKPWNIKHTIYIGLLLALEPIVYAQEDTLKGDPVDYGFESDKVCCIDVAATNALNYLDRQKGNESLIPDNKSIKDQQEDFHKEYDPEFKKQNGGRTDLSKALESTFKKSRFKALVKTFLTKDLTYETLLKEWNDDELIILLAREVTEGWGHALFLWGLELNKLMPRIAVVDPNIHPNTDHKIDSQNTNSKGTATWSDLKIGTDEKGLPDWNISLSAPEHTYKIGDVEEVYPEVTYNFRITGFVSISDVKKIPDTGITLGSFCIVLLSFLALRKTIRTHIFNSEEE